MTVCDRCRSTKNVFRIYGVFADRGRGSAENIVTCPVSEGIDVCQVCFSFLRETVVNFLRPLVRDKS